MSRALLGAVVVLTATACSDGDSGEDAATTTIGSTTAVSTTAVPETTTGTPGSTTPTTTSWPPTTTRAPSTPTTASPSPGLASPNDAVTCVYRAFLAGDRLAAVPCSVSRAAVDELFDNFAPNGVPLEQLGSWNLIGCEPTRMADLSRCTFAAPQPNPEAVSEFVWLATTDGRSYRYSGFEYD